MKMKKLQKSLWLATAASVCALSLASTQAMAASTAPCTVDSARLHVVGEGEVKVAPDLVKINYLVTALKKTPNEARAFVEESVTKLAQQIKALKLKDDAFIANDLSIVPRYDYSKDNEQKLIGYEARRTVEISLIDFSLIAKVNDMAMASGINQIQGFVYTVQDQKKHQEEAALKAIADAKAQAQLLAEGFGVELGQPCDIRFTNNGYRPVYRNANVRAYAAAPQADMALKTEATYAPEPLVIHEGVEASFVITPKK